jgi:hypothetical protein
MSVHYTAACRDSKGMRYRCDVSLGIEGWYASICHVDSRTIQRKEIFGEFVDGPDAGKAIVAGTIPRFLDVNNLPHKPLFWIEANY